MPASAQVIYQENFDTFTACTTNCGDTCDLTGTGWTNVTTDDVDWAVNSGSTGSSGTGPSGDNTTGSGNYLFIEASSPCSTGNPVAELVSPVINVAATTSPVAKVYYHMYGGDQGDLHVDVISDPNGTAVRVNDVVPAVTDDLDAWQQIGCIPLDPAAGEVQVVLRGVVGDGYESDMAIDDFSVEEVVGSDLAVTAVRTSGGSFCSTTATIEVDIQNLGGAVSGATIQYSINGGTPVVENLPSIGGCGVITHTFAAPATLAPGSTTIDATVVAAGDGDPTNDTVSSTVFLPGIVSSFPYFTDLEADNGGWYPGGTPLWEHGVPAGTALADANSGSQAWVTGLATDYVTNSEAYLYSPCFDGSAMVNPRIEAFIELDAENSWDGALVQTSTNGVNWHTVGTVAPGWYNDDSISGLSFTGDQEGFTGTAVSGFNLVAQDLGNGTEGALFQVRWVFGSDGSVQYEGISVDDISIIENPPRIDVADLSAPNIDPVMGGATDVVVQTLGIEAVLTSADISAASLGLQGTLPETDIIAVNLWLDDGDLVPELGTDDILLTAPATFSGGVASFTFSPTLALPADTLAIVHVSVDLAAGVAGGLTFGTQVTSPGQITHAGTQLVQFPFGPAVGPLSSTFQALDMLPFVDDYDGAAVTNRVSAYAAGVYPTATSTGTATATSAATANDAVVAIVPAVNGVTPNSGTGMAAIAFLNGPATGAIDYYFDLSTYDVNVDDVFVEFYHENIGATDDPEDHVFVSLDGGATWAASIYDFDFSTAGPSAWTRTQVNLSAYLRAAGLAFTNNVIIRMQAAGDTTDAVVIDDVFAGVPEAIRVERVSGTPILSGGTDNIGTIPGGTPLVATYTIYNDGQRDLDVTSSTVALTNVTNVDVVALGPDVTVPAAGSATIAFQLTVPAQGAFSADLEMATNDPRLPGVYTMTVSGVGAFDPDIELTLADGTATPSGSAQDVGMIDLGGAATIDMVIANTGGLDLSLTGTPVVDLANQVNLSAATVSTVPATIAGGASATFTVTLTPAARGAFSTQLTIASNDPDESPYTIDISGMAMEADIAVTKGGAAVPSGSTDDLGTIEVGAAQTLTYTIANGGNQDLSLSGTPVVALSTLPANVTANVTTQPAATVAAGASADAVLEVTATGEGAFTFDVTIESNDPDTPSYTITVSGTGFVPAPEITVSRSGEIPSGGNDAVGAVAPGEAQTLTYTIGNTGNVDLTVGGVTVGNTTNVTASVSSEPAATVAAGASTTFEISYTAAAEGAFSFDLTIENSDADEGTYVLTVSGTANPLAPEIAVSEGGVDRASGSSIDVGGIQLGNKASVTFTVTNEGAGPLSLSGDPTIGSLVNATATLDNSPDATVAAGDSTTFTVSVSPTAAGTFSAVVTIASDDSDEGSYTITIAGTAAGTTGGDDDDDGGCTCVTNDEGEMPTAWLGFAAFGLLLGLRRRRR